MQNNVPRGIVGVCIMTKSRLEKVLEYMVNGEQDLASEMLHEHLIETAREIYADLAEEDEAVEDELELDEDEDLDESFHDEDESGDFEDDLETMEDELETEEYFGEDEEEDDMDDMDMDDMDDDEAMDDLEAEMDMDMGDDMGDEADGDMESAMVNVEDAMDELRAVFADLVGDDAEDDMDDEVSDEFDDMDDMDMDDDLEDEELGEDAKLHKHSNVKMAGDEDGKASPIPQNASDMSQGHAKPINKFGGDEKGGKGDSTKKMSVTGPQEQKGKMDKKVAAPSNSSEKSNSLFKDKKKS